MYKSSWRLFSEFTVTKKHILWKLFDSPNAIESMKNKKAVPATILTFSEILTPTALLIEAQDNWIVKNKICTTAIYSQVLSEAINSTVNLNLLGLLRFLVYQR